LAAVFVTASQTPRGTIRVFTVPTGHHAGLEIGRAACALSWTTGGGGALCRTSPPGPLLQDVVAAVQQDIKARTGSPLSSCVHPIALGGSGQGSYVITCIDPGTKETSLTIGSPSGTKVSVGVGAATSVDTWQATTRRR
jgi:hypothetical protein